jgi:cytochrome P450
MHQYPFGLPERLNLDPRYAEVRATEPVARVQLPYGEPAWLATRYHDVKVVLSDPRFSRAASVGRDQPRTGPQQPGTGMLAMDPPEHTRLRRLAAQAFTARRVERLRPRAEEIATGLADRMVEAGAPVDLIEEFAVPLPVTVICEMLGVPVDDRHSFRIWSEAIISTTSLPPERIEEYWNNLTGYMADLVAQRRRSPTDDLISAMVRARDEADRLSETEMVELAVGLLTAGHETTATQIPNFVYVLLTNPPAWRQLRDSPDLIPGAVEELLRFVPLGAAAAFPRYATEDVELGGVTIRAGEPVLVSIGAANFDERAFAEPDRFDVARAQQNGHIGFGHGAHHCLGAQLARVELQVALGILTTRFPDLAFAVAEPDLVWKTGLFVRGPKTLPVTW